MLVGSGVGYPATFDKIVEIARTNLPPALAAQHEFKAKKAAAK